MIEAAALTDEEKARYDAAWRKYRILTRVAWLMFFTFPLSLALFGWLFSFLVTKSAAYELAFGVFGIIWLSVNFAYCYFRCPRCRQTFFMKKVWGFDYGNPWTRKCLNCGLRVYTYGDGSR